jgi:hypothetical protein
MGDITFVLQTDFETLANGVSQHVTVDIVLYAFVLLVLAITCGNVLTSILSRAWERLCGR